MDQRRKNFMGDLLMFERRSGSSSLKRNSGGGRVLNFGFIFPLAGRHTWKDVGSEEYLVSSNMEDPELLIDKSGYRVWVGDQIEGKLRVVLIHGSNFDLVGTMTPDEFEEIRQELYQIREDFVHCLVARIQYRWGWRAN
jgi:hypothetical protein